MSCPDNVHLSDAVSLPEFDTDVPVPDVTWQTKHFNSHPPREEYRITVDGRLLREDAEREVVPKDERPLSDDDDYEDSPLKQMYGMMDKERTGWTDMGFHGIFQISALVDETRFRYDLKFTDGELVDVSVADGARFPRDQ